MKRFIRTCILLGIVSAILLSMGCATAPAPLLPKHEVSIMDLNSLTGKWGGPLRFEPRHRTDDYVRLIIKENGTYQFVSARIIGIFSGSGVIQLDEGKAIAHTAKGGTIRFTLYDRGGESVLLAKGVSHKGWKAEAELNRVP